MSESYTLSNLKCLGKRIVELEIMQFSCLVDRIKTLNYLRMKIL